MTDKKDYFINLLSQYNLKPQSIKLYSIKLNNINNWINVTTEDSIRKNINKIIKFIGNIQNINDKLAYLNALIKICTDELILNRLKLVRDDLNRTKFNNYKENKKTINFISYDKILEACTPDTTINGFLLYFSVRYPVRLSLWNIRIVKTLKSMNSTDNFIYIKKNSSSLYMNDFKNVNSMGRIIIPVDHDDHIILLKYLKSLSNPVYLLYNNNQCTPFKNKDQYSRKFKQLLNHALNTEKLTMNDVRRSYESWYIQSDTYKNMENKQKDKIHERLLHTTNTAHSIYNKV